MDTLGLVESRSIAAGAELADGMLKAAEVELLKAGTICSGRYLIQVGGDRQAVATAVRFASDSGRALTGAFVVANISPQVLEALRGRGRAEPGDALGVIESRTVASAIAAADCAVKRSSVRIIRLVTGQGINGKAYFVIGGDVASVEEATRAAREALGDNLMETVVLPRPESSVFRALTGGGNL